MRCGALFSSALVDGSQEGVLPLFPSWAKVLLVGGATRMPGIKKFIENVMGVAPRDTVNPDEVREPCKSPMPKLHCDYYILRKGLRRCHLSDPDPLKVT